MVANVCIPLNLDAFILNEAVCDTGSSQIAPVTQPDYVSLRLDSSVIQHDILPPVDLHRSQPALANPRISTAGSAPLKVLDLLHPSPPAQQTVSVKQSRLGVYLHWALPRGYRAGASAASGASGLNKSENASQNPVFPPVPNRWLVVRILKKISPSPAPIDTVSAWIVESDKLRTLETLGKDVDLETEVSPYVVYDTKADADTMLQSQAVQYIGMKSPLKGWTDDPSVPRVAPLTVFNSSNPFFADYTFHNSNVFSIIDNFQCNDGTYLNQAVCDYVVVGWHSSTADGPLGANGISGTLDARLTSFLCSLSDSVSQDVKNSLDLTSILCHGVIYGVSYDAKVRPPTPADDYAKNFTDIAMEPVSVGMTPLDSIVTFLQAHNQDTGEEEHLFGPGSSDTANKILALSELLYAADDDYDSRIKASDLMYGQSFTSSLGGSTWVYDKKKDPNGPPLAPSTTKDESGMSEVDYLNRANELQQQLDTIDRTLAINRWSLFAEFFKFCSDGDPNVTSYGNNVDELFNIDPTKSSIIRTLNTVRANVQIALNTIVNPITPALPKVPAKVVPSDPFLQRSDPTLMIAGIDSGWPAEYLSRIQIRFDTDINPPANSAIQALLENLTLPDTSGSIKDVIGKLVDEGADANQHTGLGFKTWNEATFYNVDFSKWDVDLVSSPISTINHQQVRYVNKSALYDPNNPDADATSMSGRIMVLPQPSFALAAIIKQVFSTAGDSLPPNLQDPNVQKDLIAKAAQLKFISGDLTGMTDTLLTLSTGSHVKPNVRPQGQDPTPLQEAITKGAQVRMKSDHFNIIGGESAKAPFGTLVDFVGSQFQPFKGVQHGQLALTKINIVDKFGQAVCCPIPKPAPRLKPSTPDFPIHPCLADQLCPSLLPDEKTLNTVYPTSDQPTSSGSRISPFIQITPAVNQNARINAVFVEKDLDQNGKPTLWKSCSDWENPIWAWIVINYADSALQFFTGDGIFYTSLRYGGPTGTVTGLKWAPFATPPPDQESSIVSPQLVNLIQQMQGDTDTAQNYLGAIWSMIEQAIITMPFPPSQYSGYANAIVGKPLALVNVGFSLELAQPPLKAQHTLGQKPGDPVDPKIPNGPKYPTEEQAMASSNFHVKIGDSERPYDGVVCYWDTDNGTTGETSFGMINTYFPDDSGLTTKIGPTNFPKLTPFHIDPTSFNDQPGFKQSWSKQLMVKAMLVDPYTPLHLYSGILPIRSLQLPGWTLSTAMKNMTAFFTVGPVLVTKDVPKVYDSQNVLTADSWIKTQDNPTTDPNAYQIKLPIAGGKGMWNWLQPYVDPNNNTPPKPGDTNPARPLYNALPVGQEPGNLRSDPAPYTLLEGFLQLARPLIKDDSIVP